MKDDTKWAEDLFNATAGRAMRAYRLLFSLLECLRFGNETAHKRFLDDLRQTAEAHVRQPDFGTESEREAAFQNLPKQLRRQSLLEKIENLQQACEPGRTEILKNYTFDRDRIMRIDRLRHTIVHQTFGSTIDNVRDELEYLDRTHVYLSALITHRYGLKIGHAAMIEAQR